MKFFSDYKMILILGKSTLAYEIANILPDTELVGRPEYDFAIREDCDRLISTYTPDVIVNTVGTNKGDLWDTMVSNYVSVAYLTMKFYEKLSKAHIINISSTSTYWVSQPGINNDRLCYNMSKEALSNFGRHFNRKIVDDQTKNIIVSTVEPGKFNSRFNNYSGGMSVQTVANIIKQVINDPVTEISVIKK